MSGGFERVLIVINPVSTNFHKSHRWVVEFRKLLPHAQIETIETVPGGVEANAKLFHARVYELGPNTLIGVAAGDGTINQVAEILKDTKLAEAARQTVLVPLWGGNANDLAWILNGQLRKNSLKTILEQGKVMQVRPVLFSFEGALNAKRLAVMAASFGATALVARQLNQASHRRKKSQKKYAVLQKLHEGLMAWKTVMNAPVHMTYEAGKMLKIYERTFVNGPRMAKYYHIPVRLTDDCFYVDTIVDKRPVITPTALTFSLLRRARKDALQQAVSFEVHEAVWAQFDGETIQVPAKTNVTATMLAEPLYVLSTKL